MLTIDLNAIQQNWLKLSTASLANVAGVIKANAYSLGAKEIGRALYAAGCREFFLASLDEAIEARSYLPKEAVIYVLGGLRDVDISMLCAHDLIPVLCSAYDVERWLKFKGRQQLNAAAALKINTGMTRFGLDETGFFELCSDYARLNTINPKLFMSHLACADDSGHQQNIEQFNKFIKAFGQIKKAVPAIRGSLANSSGFFLGRDWHFDLVRPGAALYGINPTPSMVNPMSPVVRLTLPILQIRTLSSSEAIGYGATANLSVGAKVAVVAGGYADGVNRTLGDQPEGILFGHKVKAIGRISMDSMMFDISHVPGSESDLMQESVEVIGDILTIDDLMIANKSLGYEVLTSIGSRYERKYLPGAL